MRIVADNGRQIDAAEGAPVALLEVLAIDADPYVRNLVMNHPNVTHKILVLCELGDHS